jgi:hypothetical protein
VDEAEFWLRLEYRLCREFTGLADKKLRGIWCDGFLPEAFEIGAEGACVAGRVWVGRGGRDQEQWRFFLLTGDRVICREKIQWAELLPPDDVTGGLFIDEAARELRLRLRMASGQMDAG